MRTAVFCAFLALSACGGTDDPDAGTDAGGTDAGPPDAGPPPLPACGTGDVEALMGCVEQDRYVADVVTIAEVRVPGSAHWQTVQDLCADRFAASGFTVERHDYGTGVNVIGVLPGANDERVLVSAHYDSTIDCPGADDNATGVSGTIEIARVLASASFDRTLVVACWDEEERGLIGARAYAERAAAAGEVIVGNFVLEMIGFTDYAPRSQRVPTGFELLFPRQARQLDLNQRRGDFIAIIDDETYSADDATAFETRAARVALPTLRFELPPPLLDDPSTAALRRSDHSAFWDNDYPGMMLNDTAEFRYLRYHCVSGTDTVDQLDHDFSTRVVQATVGAAADALGLR